MATLATSVRVVLGTPLLQNFNGVLTLQLPVLNAGDAALNTLALTDLSLGTAARLSPPGFPLFLGNLGPRNTAVVLGKFSSPPVGTRLLVTLRGSYVVNGVGYGLTLSRFVSVPAVAPPAFAALRARVSTITGNAVWNYTLHNDEPAGSTQHVASFSLQLQAPVSVTGTPQGWRAQTDSMTYVLWVSDDFQPPYPTHVAPGQALAGFQLSSPRTSSESNACSLGGWDHALDDAGLQVASYVLVPRR